MTTLFTVNYSGGYGYLYEFMAQATEETYSIVDNTSRVTVYTYLRRNKLSSNGAYNLNGTAWKITIDGKEFSGTEKWDTRNTTDWQIIGSATKVVTHNSDGSKEITISASHTGNSASGSSKMGNASGSSNFILTKIPRASTIKATDANIGSPSSIYITPADGSFTHTITYSFGSLSGTVVNKTQQSPYAFTLPTSFYKEIPNDPYGVVTLTCTTYSGNTAVGTSQTTFKAYAPEEDNKPKISATIVDTNDKTTALTGNSSILVKNRSTAKVAVTATAQNSAKIKNITVNGKATSNNVATFTNVTNTKFEIIARDSRGFPNTLNKVAGTDFTMIDYLPLTLNAKFYRVSATSSEVKVKYDGNFFKGSFGLKTNVLTVKWQWKKKTEPSYKLGGVLAPTITNNKYSGEVSLGTTFDYQEAYDFIINAYDGDGKDIVLTNLNVAEPIQKGEPIYDYGVDGNGVNYLNVNGGLYIKNKDILNLIYPVGAIYMSVNSTNPATLFGGTWTQIKDTFLLAAGSTYAAGGTGGAADTTLTVANLPAHSHTGATNIDGAHIHDSNAYGWINDDVYATRRAELSINNNSGFGVDIRIRNHHSEHQHWFTTDTTGSGTKFTNMPPYIAVYVWKRTA